MSTSNERPDNAILDDIWNALWRIDTVRSLDIHDIAVEVNQGTVVLSGHVAKDYHIQLIEDCITEVARGLPVKNELVPDSRLTIEVAQALAQDKRTRPHIIYVNCFHGWVHLGGIVPTMEVQSTAEEVAARNPYVRGFPSASPGRIQR